MFHFKNWLKQSYINLVLNGTWSASYCAERCAAQLDNGRFSEADAAEIYAAVAAVFAGEAAAEPESPDAAEADGGAAGEPEA